MVKDKHIISEINGFFHKNDCNKAINSIMTTIRHLNLRSSCIGFEKRHNCKLTCLQVLELLLVFPFFMIKNSFQYNHSGLSKLFSCQKDMFYRFMNQDNIDWRKLVYQVSLCLLNRISSRKDSKTSLQCLIVDDTDLQKSGLRTELIGRIHMSFTGASWDSKVFSYVIRTGRHRPCLTSRFMVKKARIPRRVKG
jgi:hypothetical protein